jgi:RNA polymerase sigma factor (sigma-70 family)
LAKERKGLPRLSRAQRELVDRHKGLVHLHLRRRVRLPRDPTRTREREDLFQEGCIGLMRAAVSYDPKTDGAFEPYALARIRAAVHAAIYEGFATVRVPVGVINRRKSALREAEQLEAQQRAAQTDDPDRECPRLRGKSQRSPWIQCLQLTDDAIIADERRKYDPRAFEPPAAHTQPQPTGETIAQHLRDKHRIALAVAIRRVAARCRRSDVARVLQAIVDERLIISAESERTPLRALGRRFGVSIGRTVAWQQQLDRETKRLLSADRELAVLRDVASSAEAGVDERLDPEFLAKLTAARRQALSDMLAQDGSDDSIANVLSHIARAAGQKPADLARALFADLGVAQQRAVLAALQAA